jgi:Coenzyme PQQ synthesis protein D (PqqD)
MREAMFRVSDAIRSTVTVDGAILLDIRHGQILGLNRMGSAIFQMLKCGLEPPQIAAAISREFGTNVAAVQADVLEFIENLQKHDVLDVC